MEPNENKKHCLRSIDPKIVVGAFFDRFRIIGIRVLVFWSVV